MDLTNFSQKVDEKRKAGYTDTAILDGLSKNSPDFASKITQSRGRYSVDSKITNDRDLVNFLAQGFSGGIPTVQSVSETPQEQKPFTYDVAQPKVDLQTKLANANKQAEQYKQEAKQASSPLGFAGNAGRGAFDYMAASEIGLGNTLGQVYGGDQGNSIANSIVSLQNSNAQLYKQIKDKEASGKDATGMKQVYNKNVALIQGMEKDRKQQGELPTDLEFGGQVVGTALDIVTAGGVKKGLSFGKLEGGGNILKSTINAVKHPTYDTVKQGLKTLVQPVRPEISNALSAKPANLFSKQWAKNTAVNTGIGYVNDVSMNAQGFNGEENAKGLNVLNAGLGTWIGATIPTALAGEQSTRHLFDKNYKNNKIVENRIKEISQIESNNSRLRKNAKYSKDNFVATKKRVSSVDIGFPDAVDNTGTLRTKTPGGVVDQYKSQVLSGTEALGRKTLEQEGVSISPEVIRLQLKKSIMNSGLEEDALNKALKKVDAKVEGLQLRADPNGNIPLAKVHDAKIFTTNNIDYNKPSSKIEAKAIANAYKTVIENNSKTNIKEINGELSKYLKDVEFLESLDGTKVKGGKLGKYFSQIAGNIGGAAVGGLVGGPIGSAIGTVAGGEIASKIKGGSLANTFKGDLGQIAPKSKILNKAVDNLSTPPLKLSKPQSGHFPKSQAVNKPAIMASMNTPTIKSNKLINTSILPQKTAKVKTRLPIKTTESMFGAVAGIEIDENGKVTFNKEKAIAGIFAMAVVKKITPKQAAINSIKYNLPLQIKYVSKEAGRYLDNVDYSKAKSGVEVAKTISDAIPPKLKTPAILSAIDNWKKSAIQAEGEISNFKKGVVPKTSLPLKSNPLIQEAKKYKTAEEFVKEQGEVVYQTSNKAYDPKLTGKEGIFTSPSEFVAKSFGGKIKNELYISPKAKILEASQIPKQFDNFDGKDIQQVQQNLADWARKQGYDVINNSEIEKTIINPDVVKTKSQLTDIWNKAHKLKP